MNTALEHGTSELLNRLITNLGLVMETVELQRKEINRLKGEIVDIKKKMKWLVGE